MDPFDHIAAAIDAALDRDDADILGELLDRRHRMIEQRLSDEASGPASRDWIKKLIAQNESWAQRSRGIRDAIRYELDNYDATRQASIHVGLAYGATAPSAGSFVSGSG